MDAIFTRPFALLISAHFLQSLGFASMVLLPLYLDHLGAGRAEIGTIMATAAIGGVLFRPFVAIMLDTAGRKRTIVLGTSLIVGALGLFLFVDSISPLVYVLRLVMGAGIGALFTSYFTFASDLIPPSRRTQGLALFGLGGILPLALNAVEGWSGIEPKDLRLFFPAVGAVIACSLVPVFFVKDASRSAKAERFDLRRIAIALRVRTLHASWFGTAALGGLVALFISFATVAAEERGVEDPASIWLTYAGGAAVVRLFGGRFLDRFGPSLVPVALLAIGAAQLVASLGEGRAAFLTAGLLAGSGHGIGFPVITSGVVSKTPIALRGTAVATVTMIWELAPLALSPLFGALADARGDRVMFAAAAGFGLFSVVFWWMLERRGRDATVEKLSPS